MRKWLVVPLMVAAFLFPSIVLADPTVNSFGIMGTKPFTVGPITASDTSTALITAVNAANSGDAIDWAMIKSVWISVEGNDLRISYGGAASQSPAKGHVISSGSDVRLPSRDVARSTFIINKTNGSNATLQVTVEY